MVVLEIDPKFQSDPSNLERIFVAGANGAQVPLSAVVHCERGLSPLAVYHSQSFPSTTVSFNLLPDVPLEVATTNIQRAVDELHMPEGIRGSFDGNAGDFDKTSGRQPLLILGALVAMYIVLGVLYESLAHPLTIISTLPSAGLGALLALQITNTPLTVIAFVGIILLIGIVKKNGIMIVDFALDAERQRGLSSAEAIFEACSARFRPILMTTMAALFAGIPLVIATGPGTELRRPLGITIIGGLFVSQILTLYTTPVIYLLIDRLRRRPRAAAARGAGGIAVALLQRAPQAYSGACRTQPETDRRQRRSRSRNARTASKPMPLCICDSVTPIENRLSLLILQHPQEQDRALGTARLTAHAFQGCGVQDRPVLAEPVQGAGAAGRRSLALGRALSRLGQGRRPRHRRRDRRAQPQGRGRGQPARHPRQASKAWCCSTAPGARPRRCGGAIAWMLKCQRVILGPAQPSRYGQLRKEPRRDGLSTIEAAAMLLAGLERRPDIAETLNASFERMLARYREVQADDAGTGAKAGGQRPADAMSGGANGPDLSLISSVRLIAPPGAGR